MSGHILESAQKPELLEAFKLLKSHACKVANFTLQWQDLEDHLRFIDSQIEAKIQLQQNTVKNKQNDISPPNKQLISTQDNNNPETEINDEDETENKTSSLPVKNGKELILYVREHREDVGSRLHSLFKAVDDPGKLILEALEEFYPPGLSKGQVVDSEIRRNCVVLLEEFGRVRERVEPHVREEAKRLAVEWKGRVVNSLEALGFLQLLIGFDLVNEFDSDEVLKHFDNAVMRREAPELLRALGLADKVSEIIEKLIKKNRRLEAIRFICEYDLVKQFSPVPLLRAHAKYAKKVAEKIRKEGNNSPKAQDCATNSEIAALRGMIRFINNYQLSSQYSPKILINHIQQLERERKQRKGDAKATVSDAQYQQHKGNKRTSLALKAQQNGNKQPCTVAADATAYTSLAIHSKEPYQHQPATSYTHVGADSYTHLIQPPLGQSTSLLKGAQPLISSLGNYLSAVSAPVTSYTSLASGPYGSAGSGSVHPHKSSSPGTYERTVPANGSSWQFGLARTHSPMNFASNANTNVSAPYYHGDLSGPSAFYNRQASSSSTGMAPNTSSNTSGYYDMPVSITGNLGLSSKYPPSVYHP